MLFGETMRNLYGSLKDVRLKESQTYVWRSLGCQVREESKNQFTMEWSLYQGLMV